MANTSDNAKTNLVELCQRYTGKSMDKGDITYTVSDFQGSFQATVKLDCINGQEFAGELCATQKDAEKAAAAQALEGLAQDIGLGIGNKRKAEGPQLIIKQKLREAVKQILARDLTETDVVFEVKPAAGGHTATLKIPTVPGMLGKRVFMGTPSPFKRDTMLTAASKALDAILADAELSSKIDLSKVKEQQPTKKAKTASSGGQQQQQQQAPKGNGKGQGMPTPQMMEMMMMMMMKGKGKGKFNQGDMTNMMNMMQMMSGKGGGGGSGSQGPATKKKAKKPAGPDLPRERITQMPITGEIVDWKGKFGWIKPHEQIVHKVGSKNKGNVYVHSKDVADGKTLEKGATVQFQAYADSSGLGAEEVLVL